MKHKRIPLRLFMLYGLILLALANSFGVLVADKTCRTDVNGCQVRRDGSRERTDVFGDTRKTSK